MTRFWYMMIVLVMLLAACGGNGESDELPTLIGDESEQSATQPAPPVGEGEEMDPDEFDAMIDQILAPTDPPPPPATLDPDEEGALPIAPPGTLVASETQEAEPAAGPFEYIYFQQEGGAESTQIIFEITSDGTVVNHNNDRTATISAAQVAELDQLIMDLNFFGLQGTFLGPPTNGDSYRYRVAIARGESERFIQAQDGYMPRELIEFLGALRQVGDDTVLGG